MYLREESQGAGVLCVREGVDAVAECRKSLDVTTATTTQSHWKWPTRRQTQQTTSAADEQQQAATISDTVTN